VAGLWIASRDAAGRHFPGFITASGFCHEGPVFRRPQGAAFGVTPKFFRSLRGESIVKAVWG
jgi:hypothetical protein